MAWNVGNGTLGAAGQHPRAPYRHFPAPEHDLAVDGPRSRGAPLSDVRVPRPAVRRPVLFQHRVQHFQAGPNRELEQLAPRIDQDIDQRQWRGDSIAGGGGTVRDFFMAAPLL